MRSTIKKSVITKTFDFSFHGPGLTYYTLKHFRRFTIFFKIFNRLRPGQCRTNKKN